MSSRFPSSLHVLCMLTILLGCFTAGKAFGDTAQDTVIRVGCERDFKPYSFVDENGQAAGFGVDLIRAVAEAMDIPVKVYPDTWDNVWNGLIEGRFDALPIVAKLPSRTEFVDLGLSHTETFDSFFVRSGDPVIEDIAEADGKEIIVMRSDAAEHALEERAFEGEMVTAETISEMLELLASGKHDAVLFPKLLGLLKIKEMGLEGVTAGPTIPDYKREFSFGVQKGDTELLEKLNQGLLIVKSNGEYDRIYEKWFGFEDPWHKYEKYIWPASIVTGATFVIFVFSLVMLQRMVKSRTIELAEKNLMLNRARRELSQRVEQRTAELKDANAALKAENAERRLAEATLRESEERYRSYIEVTGQLGWVTDPDGSVVNDLSTWRRYTGQSLEEIKGFGWTGAVHPDDLDHTLEVWQRSLEERTPYEVEYRLRKHDGGYRHFMARGIPVLNDDGAVREWVGTSIDITERKRAEQALRRAHDELELRIAERTSELKEANLKLQHEIAERKRMEDDLTKAQKLESLGVLAGGIAHDLNNFLQTITNCVNVAKMHVSEDSSLKEVLKDAETASKHASTLSHRLLTFAKGGSPVKKVSSIAPLIEESVSLSMRGSDVVCETTLPGGLHPVEVDEGQINQVLNNLIINAKEAMPDGGAIKINAENVTIGDGEHPLLEKGPYVRVSVEDHGTGIKQEHLNKIFDPYFSTKERGAVKGTGLGLSVCHSVISNHGGAISVDSTVGAGTTFHVFLPASEKPLAKGVKKEASSAAGGGRVLFMEDEKNMWLSTRLIFKAMGYKVDFAVNGAEALSLYKEALSAGEPFDGVILDLTIPGGMGGKETITRLRELDGGVKAIVVSGYAEDPVITNFEEYGFVSALTKPFTVEQLKDAVRDSF